MMTCDIYTAEHCTDITIENTIAGKVVVINTSLMTAKRPGQLYFCRSEYGKKVTLVSLINGAQRTLFGADIIGVLKPELLPDAEKLQLSQIKPEPDADAEDCEKYIGYCFLEDGRYTSGVWLNSPKEAVAYLKAQMPYQYRILLCDVLDLAVLEIKNGKVLRYAPDVRLRL
jgi:hypothetical protein